MNSTEDLVGVVVYGVNPKGGREFIRWKDCEAGRFWEWSSDRWCQGWIDRNSKITRMWANAQRDGSPAKYRWRPLFNAAMFGWRPILECRAVMLPISKTCWNLQGCPKLVNRSQPLVGRSSPYCEDMWRRYCSLTSFFFDCRHVP